MNILNKYNDLFTQEIFDDIDYEKAIEQHLNDLEGTIENENYRNKSNMESNEVYPEVYPEEATKKPTDDPTDIYDKKPKPIIVKEDPLKEIDIIETNAAQKDKTKDDYENESEDDSEDESQEDLDDPFDDENNEDREDDHSENSKNKKGKIKGSNLEKQSDNHPTDDLTDKHDKEQTKKNIDNISKKHNDFKRRLFVYKPGEMEMKFINNLPSDSYINVQYLNGKNKNDEPLSLSTQDLDIKAIIQPSNQVSYITTEYYKQTHKKDTNDEIVWYPNILNKKYVDIIGEVNNALNAHHSFLSYQDFKSILIAKYPNLIDEINYFIQQPTDKTPSKNGDWFAKFIDSYAMFFKYQLVRSHTNDNKVLEVKNTTLNKSKTKRNFNVIVLPKDVIEIIRHINYYFKDIKNKLTLDNKTGFYLLDVQTDEGKQTKLPIMCRHVFMTLSGKSLYQISKECCLNGQCKYCGDSMISFVDDDATNIPPAIAELTYRLIECSDAADDDGTFLVIYNIFTSVIYSFVQQDDPNYDNKAVAIVSLYVYKIINELIRNNVVDKTISNVKKLIAIIADNCSVVGWDESKMEKLLQNTNLFNNIDLFVKLLSGNQDKILDLGDNLKKTFDSTSSTEVKKLSENNEIHTFNTINEISILDDVNFDFIQNIIDELKNEFKTKNKPSDIYGTAINTLELFEKISKKYCPANYIHDFEKGECKYCGLKSDGSNAKKVYEKYEREFNQKFELNPINKLSKFKEFKSDIDPIKKGLETIKEGDIKNYIKTKLNLNEDEYKKVNNYVYEVINDIVSVISNYTYVSTDKIWKLKMDEILRVYLYLDKIEIAPGLMEIFRYGLLPPATYIKTKDKTSLFEDDE